MPCVNNGKFVINFPLSQAQKAVLCIHEMVFKGALVWIKS